MVELASSGFSNSASSGIFDVTASQEVEFARFYEENIHQLTRTLAASLGDPQVAQDAAQEAMARACERWTKIGKYDNPTGWCFRVAMNWATSRWRKRRREVTTDEDRRAGSVENVDLEVQDRLLVALRTLSVDQRSVVVLRLVEDWSIAETAQALGIAEGTVQSRYARALKNLRAQLGDFYE